MPKTLLRKTTAPPVDSAPETAHDVGHRMSISVNLLPDEVRVARANRSARQLIGAALLATAVGTGAWYYHVHQATDAASSQLAQAQDQAAASLRGQRAFVPLKTTRAQISRQRSLLTQSTKGDVSWSRLVPRVRQVMPRGVTLTGITGTATVSTQTNPAAGTAGASGTSGVAVPTASGSILITGIANSKNLVSSFSEQLSTVPGLANAQITVVQADASSNRLTFSIQAATTNQALSTRYAKAVK